MVAGRIRDAFASALFMSGPTAAEPVIPCVSPAGVGARRYRRAWWIALTASWDDLARCKFLSIATITRAWPLPSGLSADYRGSEHQRLGFNTRLISKFGRGL